jgi:16S rRNA (uracil1498-N3)-methyltransferase
MQRYFLDEQDNLTKIDQNHIIKVLRMRSNDRIIVCKEVCHDAIIHISGQTVTYTRLEQRPKIVKRHITLVQGLPKAPKIETTIKYATMAGVSKILIVPMHYSQVKQLPKEIKFDRYHMIAKEASELSHRDDIPEITALDSLNALDFSKPVYLLDELSDQKISDHLEDITIIVGPEGGIHKDERLMLLQKGAKAISLGPLILSSEIAGVIAISQLIRFDKK